MIGLDSAGKTTILFKLSSGSIVDTIPTIGFNVEVIKYNKTSLIIWDISGQEKMRVLWKNYFKNVKGIIFVLDSNDRKRIINNNNNDNSNDNNNNNNNNDNTNNVHYALKSILNTNELRSLPLLIFANKQDLPDAMEVNEISKHFNLSSIIKNRKWHIQPTCALTGDGLYEGLEWLSNTLHKKK